jgi:diguanylate cyclase (GGDEF)-like protein
MSGTWPMVLFDLLMGVAWACVAYLIAEEVEQQWRLPTFAGAVALFLLVFVAAPLRISLVRQHRDAAGREQALLHERERTAFHARLDRALAMAQTEQEALDASARAIRELAVDLQAEVLLVDSSRAHMARAASTHTDGPCGCGVSSPSSCPAVRSGHTLRFRDSRSLDACPQLAQRVGDPVEAVCVPMSMMGRAVGVLHAVTPMSESIPDPLVERLESVARQVGSRVELVTVITQTKRQANTDSLTGLLNRRSLENEARRLTIEGRPFAIALADLDRFKDLNDTFGHDMGDRALRLFSRTMRSVVRENDIVARYGGEEFVVVFPDITATTARDVFDRIRLELAAAVGDGRIPPFTVSAGIVDTNDAAGLGDLITYADALLLEAKRGGRNRVLVSGEIGSPSKPPGRSWSAPAPDDLASMPGINHISIGSPPISDTIGDLSFG